MKEDIFEFLIGYVENKKVFELGFGVGRMTEEIAKKAEFVFAIDFSKKMFEKAGEKLKGYSNVELRLGKITEMELPPKSFDLVFEPIVLLHILKPENLLKTVKAMKNLSDTIFLVEHTYEGSDFPISHYSILRKPEEYAELFKPYVLLKQKIHKCAGDTFTMMLFQKPG